MSNELFYLDANGKKQDAKLHEEMLANDNPKDRDIARKIGKEIELTDAQLDLLYPDSKPVN